MDCLEHIRGTKKSELLNDLPNIYNILKQEGKKINEDELDIYKFIINNYESIIKHKKKRNQKKSKNGKKNLFVTN